MICSKKMATSKFSFFFFFLLIFAIVCAMARGCSHSRCSPVEIDVRFPFRLNDQQPEYCGYPGFSLTCKAFLGMKETILGLPFAGEFLVRDINYLKQEIQLKDPGDCLAKRLLDFNLSGSPFKSAYHQDYTFINCSSEIEYVYGVVDCLGSDKYTVLALSSRQLDRLSSFYRNCEVIKTISVPADFPEFGWSRFILSWDEPDCQYCQGWNGKCILRSNSTQETCPRKTGRTTTIICIMSISIGLSVLCLISINNACLKVAYVGGIAAAAAAVGHDGEHHPSNTEPSTTISPQPIVRVIGLNDSTIDSYPKIVLGESRRLPKPDDNTCPICLSEYRPKETLKIIPKCNHGFHACCIDEWLRMNMTCPVCRNSPALVT